MYISIYTHLHTLTSDLSLSLSLSLSHTTKLNPVLTSHHRLIFIVLKPSFSNMASSKPLNPNANPYLSNSTVLLGQQSQCSAASTLLLTHQTPSFSLLAYYWPKYYYSCYSPNLNVQAHTPLLYQPKVVSHSSLPLSSEPPKCLKVPSPSSELVSHGGDGERRACEARRRKIGVPKKNRRESPEVSPEKTSEKKGSGESTVDNNIGCGVIGFSEFSEKTTLMLKNIPNHFRLWSNQQSLSLSLILIFF